MNTTKFRGKSLSTGEWVYGNLIQTPTKTYILETEHEVEFIEPEYHEQGMGCGLEDRNITDRYEAMFHGFERALDKCAENHPPFIEVDPNTVGQYVGVKDANNIEIYADDIADHKPVFQARYVVKYLLSGFYLCPNNNDYGEYFASLFAGHDGKNHCRSIEVIGNIHDNPTLLTQ